MKISKKESLMKNPQFAVDLTKPRSSRPMTGLDIEQWRAERGMAKYDAQYALGFRNSNHYNKMCLEPVLPATLELLIRIYEESPLIPGPGWKKYSLPELFNLMYGEALSLFKDTPLETYAKVDFGTRFTKIFDRSSARQYQWLEGDSKRNESDLNAYSVMECILSKLCTVDDPKQVLEKAARKVWLLRGVDLDSEFPVPSPTNPPTRQKTGRKSKLSLGVRKVAKVVKVAKVEKILKPAAKAADKAAPKRRLKPEMTPEQALEKSVKLQSKQSKQSPVAEQN
jgi:hypothetical protein